MAALRSLVAAAMIGFAGTQPAPRLFVNGVVQDGRGTGVAGVRVTADGNLAESGAVTGPAGTFTMQMRSDVLPGNTVWLRTIDPQKRFEPWWGSVVVALQPQPQIIALRRVAAGAGTTRLTLFIERIELGHRSGRALRETTLTVPDQEAGSAEASTWVRGSLAELFPALDEAITVNAALNSGPDGPPVLVTPPDARRDDRLWMFARDTKIGHPNILAAQEAAGEAVVRAIRNAESVVLHFDRPGYELGVAQLGTSGVTSLRLQRRQNPAMTAVVNVEGNDPLNQRLRAILSAPDFQALPLAELEHKRRYYEQSMGQYLSIAQRLTLLRQSRVDVYVGGVFERLPH